MMAAKNKVPDDGMRPVTRGHFIFSGGGFRILLLLPPPNLIRMESVTSGKAGGMREVERLKAA